jgi:uncharacterized membrane protein YdcZ (DUF606 family)
VGKGLSSPFISLLGGGMAQTYGLIVAGQVIVTVLLDHFNLLGEQQHAINLWRILD